MKNKLIDISTNTMVGMFPTIVCENNKRINDEFAEIYDDTTNKIIKDVQTSNVQATNGTFATLSVDHLVVNGEITESSSESSVNARKIAVLESKIAELEALVSSLQTMINVQ